MSAALSTEEDRWRVGGSSRILAKCRVLIYTVVGWLTNCLRFVMHVAPHREYFNGCCKVHVYVG